MKYIKRLAAVALLVAAVAAGYWYYRNHKPAAVSAASTTYTQVVAVKTGTLSSTISVVGQLEALQSASPAFDKLTSTTKLLTLTIKAGSTVTNGQVLATVDPTPYQTALDQANSSLAAAQKTLADLKTPATALALAQADLAVAKAQLQVQQAQNALDKLVTPDIPSLESAVASAQSALAQAQANVLAQQQSQSYKDQLSRLVTAEATPTADYNRLVAENGSPTDAYYQDRLELAYKKMMDAQDARVTYQVQAQVSAAQAQMSERKAEQTLADARDALATAKAGGDPLVLANAKVTLKDAQVALQAAQDARTTLTKGSDATTIATAQANVDKLQLAANDAKAALAGTKLVAPFDGTILKTNVNVGDQVAANTIVLTVANLKTLQVAANIDETTIKNVKEGQTAVVTFDAFPGQQLQGKVGAIPLQGTLQGGIMIYTVPISLTGADKLALLVGMTANVKIQAGTATNALLVPSMALTKANGQYQVMVPNTTSATGAPEAVPVQVGLSDGTYTQITKGLNEGDNVIVQLKSSTSGTQNQSQIPGGGGGNQGPVFVVPRGD